MTTQDMLDRRYGRRQRPASRWLIGAGIGLAAIVVLLFSWTVVSSSMNAVDADTTGFELVDERTVTIAFQFTSPPGRGVACTLEAQDDEHGVVGWKVVEYEPTEMHGRAFTETIPTTAQAASVFVNTCWVT